MEAIDVLIEARKRIEDPEHWTQAYTAKDKEGIPISPRSENAYSFCLIGALESVPAPRALESSAQEALYSQLSWTSIGHFNDSHTHSEVLGLLDSTIAELSNE